MTYNIKPTNTISNEDRAARDRAVKALQEYFFDTHGILFEPQRRVLIDSGKVIMDGRLSASDQKIPRRTVTASFDLETGAIEEDYNLN